MSCEACKCAFTGTSKPQTCVYCGSSYHMKCFILQSVRNEKDIAVNACSPCIAAANTGELTRPRTSSVSSAISPISLSVSMHIPPSSATICGCTPDFLVALMEKLNKLDSLHSLTSSIATIDTKMTSVVENISCRRTK